MKIRMSTLRALIREAVVNQMAFAGKVSSTKGGAGATGWEDEEGEHYPSHKTLRRYFNTPKYTQRAGVLLQRIPLDIWLAPVIYGYGMDEEGDIDSEARTEITQLFSGDERVVPVSAEDGIDLLARDGGYKIEDLEGKVGPSSAIIVPVAGSAEKNYTPSVWMTLHAFFDNEDNLVRQYAGDIGDKLTKIIFGLDKMSRHAKGNEDEEQVITSWLPYLPFPWAKRAASGSFRMPSRQDVISEILVAAAFRKEGFVPNQPKDGKLDPSLIEAVTVLANEGGKEVLDGISKFLAGKVTFVLVSEADDYA